MEGGSFLQIADDYTVIIPSPNLGHINFHDILLPQKRRAQEGPPGYPISRFLTPPPIEFLCVVCQNVVKRPQECKKCGKLYCDFCSSSAHKTDELSGNRTFTCCICGATQAPRPPSQLLTRMIAELKIKCTNFEAGCVDYITIDDFSRHEQICPYGEVKCENRSCKTVGLIKNFKEIEGVSRSIYSHSYHRGHGRGKSFVCSEKCKRFVLFEKMVCEKQVQKALRDYYDLLCEIKNKEV
jgi:hypothetical protein